ncbi:hypothetical protein BJ085DRAFT_30334 [Dimargaris cristalligena]|uniref:Uncharacterized protein n=1 Tax=Dimargaris cristalligena TaxID=215637 RepID=A0A4Q0A2Y6_9FUNG|nr:hypothetical protein BJ085DRAFT_30334 [Dimargaris cristalligena]|eukprot:RKP40208.1 hypothetical protein BJ085DRAFT_30334 [Dimargaris cristalligena]
MNAPPLGNDVPETVGIDWPCLPNSFSRCLIGSAGWSSSHISPSPPPPSISMDIVHRSTIPPVIAGYSPAFAACTMAMANIWAVRWAHVRRSQYSDLLMSQREGVTDWANPVG